jgi:hypothetical protein
MSDCRAENTEEEEIERLFASVLGYFFIWKFLRDVIEAWLQEKLDQTDEV